MEGDDTDLHTILIESSAWISMDIEKNQLLWLNKRRILYYYISTEKFKLYQKPNRLFKATF
uniref:Uncharacterized protein n=1 Tax=Romanomermis culicivorax TaxID=13658 RepID=A0A915JND8_ROMCU